MLPTSFLYTLSACLPAFLPAVRTDLFQGDLKVGTVVWTGTYIEVTGSNTRVNYLVNL